jgi:hypothetical protein
MGGGVCVNWSGGSHTATVVDEVILDVWSDEKNWSRLAINDRKGCFQAWIVAYHTTADYTV